MASRAPLLAVLSFAGLAAVGCFSAGERREDVLIKHAREWSIDFQWGRWEQAGEKMPADEAKLLIARAADIGDDLEFAGVEVKSISFGAHSDKATVILDCEWSSKRKALLHHTVIEQTWAYESGRWLMKKQHRTRGDRLPLIPEPVAPPTPTADGGAQG